VMAADEAQPPRVIAASTSAAPYSPLRKVFIARVLWVMD
jgi:hypothetical protein